MSAVRKEQVLLKFPEQEPGEPRFESEAEMMAPPIYGANIHSDEELRLMWTRIWKCFKSIELCRGFMFYQKLHTLERWRYAFEYVRCMKNDNFKYIRYVKKVADGYEINGTPDEIAEREAKANQAKLAEQARRGIQQPTASPVVLNYWAEKGRTKSLDEIPDDDPSVLRMARKLKGDGRK